MGRTIKDVMRPIGSINFRYVVNKVIYIECRELIEEMYGEGVDKKLTGLIGYCYIDHETGLSFQPGVVARVEDDTMQLADLPSNEIMQVIRIRNEHFFNEQEIEGKRIAIRTVSGNALCFPVHILIDDMSMFDEFIKRFDCYIPIDEVIELRKDELLDPFRCEFYPDDVQVVLYGENKMIEHVWVRCEYQRDGVMYGTLLNEPYGDLGYHKGECIGFVLYDMDGENILINNGKKLILD